MRAWIVSQPGPIDGHPLELIERDDPRPGPGQILVKVHACGVCRTDLHLAEGDLVPRRSGVIPGHEIVGLVEAAGENVTRFKIGDRIGIAWLGKTCGHCRYCTSGSENLCASSRYTGWDEDGGFGEYAVADQDYAYSLPEELSDQQAAPLLCSGIIGFRSLMRAELPKGGRLGIYGFGASAHLAMQVALFQGARVHVITRSAEARDAAMQMGAASAGELVPPEPLDAAILFAPVGTLVPPIMEALDRGGTLAIAGIHLSDIPSLDYDKHVFQEKTLRSVTANTRADGEAFLELAARMPIKVTTVPYGFEQADLALADLAHDRFTGAAVLTMDG